MEDAVDGLESLLQQSSIESETDNPRGFLNLKTSIYVKSKKLAFPALLFLGATAAATVSIASGGAALLAILGICGGSIKLLSVMQDIYKEKKKIKKTCPRPQKSKNK